MVLGVKSFLHSTQGFEVKAFITLATTLQRTVEIPRDIYLQMECTYIRACVLVALVAYGNCTRSNFHYSLVC